MNLKLKQDQENFHEYIKEKSKSIAFFGIPLNEKKLNSINNSL